MAQSQSNNHKTLLYPVQRLHTSGARAVEAFKIDSILHLAIPQLAEDIPDFPSDMNGGNSDVGLIIFRHNGTNFEHRWTLPLSGGEDAEFFQIGDRAFLAVASLRSGKGPYELDVDSVIFEWQADSFVPFQKIPTFAAKQWRHFNIDGRHFLALAQGVVMENLVPKHPSASTIFQWNGSSFVPFQTIDSAWGYNWHSFQVDGHHLLGYADHKKPSVLLRWTGTNFEPFQTMDGNSGRAFCFFEAEGTGFLAFANLGGDSFLYCWESGKFIKHQTLSGPGGREFAYLQHNDQHYLIQINFLIGTPQAPVTTLNSIVYRFENGFLHVAETFPTLGGTDVAAFEANGETHLAISESLSAEVHFRTDSQIWRFGDS